MFSPLDCPPSTCMAEGGIVLVLTPSGCENLAKYCKTAVQIMKPFSEFGSK